MTRANAEKLKLSCTRCGLLERDLYTCPAVTCKYRKKHEEEEEAVETVPVEPVQREDPNLQDAIKRIMPDPQALQ